MTLDEFISLVEDKSPPTPENELAALMWIMDDPFGNSICLGLEGEHFGKVYHWDHENEPVSEDWDGDVETAGNVTLLANSFSEFVADLQDLNEA